MNRNLFVFAMFLIIVGLFFGFSLVSIFGIIMLIPALAASSQPPKRQSPSPTTQQPSGAPPRRYQPHPPPTTSQPPRPTQMAVGAPPPGEPMPTMAAPSQEYSPHQTPSYTPALFPMPFLPSLSTMGTTQQPARMAPEPKREGRDELVEMGIILAVLKLAFG